MWEGQLSSLIHTAQQVHMCTPIKLYHFPLNISTSQRSTTSLSHLLGCLVRDLNYGPWPVTAIFRSPQIPTVERYTELPLAVFSSHHTFLLSVQNEQTEWKVWNFRHGEGELADFAVNSR